MSEEDLSRVLRTLGFAGDVTPAKLAWAARIKTAQPVVAFLCSGALGPKNVLTAAELEAYAALAKSGKTTRSAAQLQAALRARQEPGADLHELLSGEIAQLTQAVDAARERVRRARAQRAGLSEELARLKDTRVHVSSALALREKQLALAHTSLHRQTLRHETLRTELVAACARLTGAHTDAVLCAPRVDSYVAAERASVSSMTRLLALVAAIQTRSRSARFEDELRRLHAAFVLTRSAHAHRRIAHGAVHQLEFAAAAGDDAAHVTQQLRRQALAILERVPALVAEVALLPCQRVVLADVEAKVTALQQLQHAASTLATALHDQNSRLIAVRSTLREETEHCCHAATLLKAVTEEFHGAAEMCAQRTAALGAPPDVAADNNDAGALARMRLLTLASGRPGASEAAMLEALDKAATAGLAARAAAADEMRAAVRTFEALHKQVAPLLFPLGGAQAQWRAPEVAEQLERCRDALRRAGESLASVEKQRARVEAEWTHRPPPLVQLERNMMALFWEDPVSTAKLNAQLAKVAAL